MLSGVETREEKEEIVERKDNKRRSEDGDSLPPMSISSGEFKDNYGPLRMSQEAEVRRNVFNKLFDKL